MCNKKPGKTLMLIGIISLISSCETLGINLSGIFSQTQSDSTSGTQGNSGTPISSNRSSTNTNRRADPDATNWDIATLDTAADVDYLTAIEKDIILEMNKVRTNPKKYVELYIQPRLRYYSGKNYSVPGQITIVTQEGTAAVNNCITALNRASLVGVLMPEKGLSLAAKDHVTDQSKTGQTGHNGSDRSTPVSRAGRYGKGQYIGENIAYGNNIGREIVCSLLIDDGVPSRGHRTNIMKADYTQTGVGIGTHPEYRNMCVIAYANGYNSN